MKIGIKSGGSAGAQWPRGTARPTVYCISFPTSVAGRLGNIASGHNFLYAPMTLQKVAAASAIIRDDNTLRIYFND